MSDIRLNQDGSITLREVWSNPGDLEEQIFDLLSDLGWYEFEVESARDEVAAEDHGPIEGIYHEEVTVTLRLTESYRIPATYPYRYGTLLGRISQVQHAVDRGHIAPDHAIVFLGWFARQIDQLRPVLVAS